ncbi:MAG: hypothetical protein CJBNEKGG_00338 [Prosthecobacter sp.]|nr:hypothetical protein [Prosthecobacter sp.]
MNEAPASAVFAHAARQVARRVMLRRWLAALARTLWFVAGVLLLMLLSSLALGLAVLASLTWLAIALWGLLTLGWTFWRRPGHYSILALWDREAGRREAFANAWWFESRANLTEAQRSHILAQQELLTVAMKSLPRDLPLHFHRHLWLPPVLALSGLLLARTLDTAGPVILVDAAMQQVARDEAARLARADWQKKNLGGLTADEKAELEKLRENLRQTAEDLENAGGRDARDVMSSLGGRAREAEKLAERLSADKETWASEKLIQSLRQHADTADLGDAVAARNAGQTAAAAEALAEKLKSPQLSNDTRERLNETLKDNERSAEKQDRTRPVGQHVLSASGQMQAAKPAEAGDEFQKLAEKMRDQARREKAQQEMEKLAQQLRDASSSITGQNQAGSMQQMAGSSQQGRQQQNQPQSQAQSPQAGQAQQPGSSPQSPQMSGQPQLQPPGMGQQQMLQQNPVPGTGQQQRMMMAQPGSKNQSPRDGQPMLLAPIPGQQPGEKPPDALLLGPQGPPPQDGPMIGITTPGGKEAGLGRAELNAAPTPRQDTVNQAVVAAQQNNEGSSSVRSLEGGARQEDAVRSASQIAIEALSAQEEALDEMPLPPSRREQVRRYFTELRKRFEKE